MQEMKLREALMHVGFAGGWGFPRCCRLNFSNHTCGGVAERMWTCIVVVGVLVAGIQAAAAEWNTAHATFYGGSDAGGTTGQSAFSSTFILLSLACRYSTLDD